MSLSKSGKAAHDSTVVSAESTLQSAVAVASTQAAVTPQRSPSIDLL
jgi:hypothetical protein